MLNNLGLPAIPLHGNLSQPKRLGIYSHCLCYFLLHLYIKFTGALNKFKSSGSSVLIATDVASRFFLHLYCSVLEEGTILFKGFGYSGC
jgi:ATP-dependent RNA helicase DDX47/RRP3